MTVHVPGQSLGQIAIGVRDLTTMPTISTVRESTRPRGAFGPDADVEVTIVDDEPVLSNTLRPVRRVNGEVADSSTAGGYPFVGYRRTIDRTLGVALNEANPARYHTGGARAHERNYDG